LPTSDKPQPSIVLQPSTTTPTSVLSHGFTAKEQEIFYRLLVELFLDNPRRKKPQAKEESENDDKGISTRESD
jgi:hypothetical protein